MNKKIAMSAVSILTALALAGGATFAFFTDTDTSANNTFAAGTLDINIVENTTGLIPFNVTNMAPDQEVTKCGGVSNNGTLDFNWKFSLLEVTPTPTVNLNAVLNAKIEAWTGVGAPSTTVCEDDTNTTNWSVIYNGPVSAATNPDNMGLLSAGNTAYFRLTASLPNTVGNEYQGGSAAYQFKVDAFQIDDPTY